MIDVTVDIPRWDWRIRLHCSVTCYHTDAILNELRELGCPQEHIRKAESLMRSCRLNTGLTFSNSYLRESVVVVATTSSAAEFQNSLQHELRHAIDDMVATDEIYNKEAVGYLTGDINAAIFPHVSSLLCENCRKNVRLFEKGLQ